MPQKTYTFGYDSESECNAIYDENGNFVRGWQNGDEIYRVLSDVLSKLDVKLLSKSISVDGDFPIKIQ
jgi:hypothetical protein